MSGKIILIPVTLGDSSLEKVIPQEVIECITPIRHFIVENVRTARRFLRKAHHGFPIDESTFYELNKHTKPQELSKFLQPARNGGIIGLMSEAGVPGVADPGADIVAIAHEQNIMVQPMVGPSSIILSVMASGLNGQNFAFNGYLPVKGPERIKKIKALESRSSQEKQSQLFIETPYRNMALLSDLLKTCNPTTKLCIAADITLESEYIQTKSVKAWKKALPELNKRPAIFILQG
jgi:16S rRNA (cytidine1402-2'-O)-methyltransferase